jgi:hypothetical protein
MQANYQPIMIRTLLQSGGKTTKDDIAAKIVEAQFGAVESKCSLQSDRTEHPWCNRRDFSTLAFNGRNRIDEILDKMLTLIKEGG